MVFTLCRRRSNRLIFLLVASALGPTLCAAQANAQPNYENFVSDFHPQMVNDLREIADRNPRMFDDSLTRIGDSATVNWGFLRCFGMDQTQLASWGRLQGTIDHFRGRHRIFRRESLAAGVGWSSPRVLTGGRQAPLYTELRAVRPRFALIHFGGNDMQGENLDRYAHWMWAIVDRLTARGVIPVLTTVMPRGDDPEKDALVPIFNASLRALAQGWGLPLIDLHGAMSGLPNRGLAGDGMHPNSYIVRGQTRTCDFRHPGLRHGNNVRNLITMMMLDRLRRHVIDGEPPPNRDPEPLRGAGSTDDPWRVIGWPFTHMSATTPEQPSAADEYRFGGELIRRGGGERVYAFELPERTRFVAQVIRRRQVDLEIFLLRVGEGEGLGTLVLEPAAAIDAELPAGRYRLLVDGQRRRAGGYLLVADVPGVTGEPYRWPQEGQRRSR